MPFYLVFGIITKSLDLFTITMINTTRVTMARRTKRDDNIDAF